MSKFNIVLYGDSNTYGYSPDGSRYDERYGKVLKKFLGEEYDVFEEGVVGRTTIYSDKRVGKTAYETIDLELQKYKKINLLVVMLGTNDYKVNNAKTIEMLEYGVNKLISKIKDYNNIDKILLISPILLDENIELKDPDFNHNSYILSLCASVIYKNIAKKNNLYFYDAKNVAFPGSDGEHFTRESHISLGNALANYIKHNIIDHSLLLA